MAAKAQVLSHKGLLALFANDAALRQRLLDGQRLQAKTPFMYPGRLGPVVFDIALAPETQLEPSAVVTAQPATRLVRISDGGTLLKSLAEQGMELEVDMILSKTVFHALKQYEGAGIANNELYVDTPPDQVGEGLWRLLQMVAELLGLRHAKYKDALIQFERRKDAEADRLGWRPT